MFLGLRETAGYYWNLKLGFEEMGITCTYADLSGNPHRYELDARWWSRAARAIASRRRASGGPARIWWRGLQVLLTALVLAWAIPRHDFFIIGSPQSLLVRIAFPLLQVSRKPVISILHGSDSRPPYLNAKFTGDHGPIDARALIDQARDMRRELAAIERWSTWVVSHPPSSQYLKRPFVDFLSVGMPAQVKPMHAPSARTQVRVLHAPSHLAAKGTTEVRRAIATLPAMGVDVDYVELEGRANIDVLEALQHTDIAVDQAYSDQPMPGFATEAGAYGVPAIVGGCDWDSALAMVDGAPPTLRCHPEQIASAIARLAGSESVRRQLGADARSFLADAWQPRQVAERLHLLATSRTCPTEWKRNPNDVTYVHGVGLSEERIAAVVKEIVALGGTDAFLLDDKPHLVRRLLAVGQRLP